LITAATVVAQYWSVPLDKKMSIVNALVLGISANIAKSHI